MRNRRQKTEPVWRALQPKQARWGLSGGLLQQQRACGRMLIYYFNEGGTVIQSDQDFAIQIPIETLRQCPNIIGVCSANTSVKALEGALRTGIFTHLAARSKLVKALLDN